MKKPSKVVPRTKSNSKATPAGKNVKLAKKPSAKKSAERKQSPSVAKSSVTYFLLEEGALYRLTEFPGDYPIVEELKSSGMRDNGGIWERSNHARTEAEIGEYEPVVLKTKSLGQALLMGLKIATKSLTEFKVEFMPEGFDKSEYYQKGDEDCHFISETYLYNLIGKEDARSVLGRVRRIEKFLAGYLISGVK